MTSLYYYCRQLLKNLTWPILEYFVLFDIFEVSETKLRLKKAPINSVIIPGTTLTLLKLNAVMVVHQYT